MPGIARTWSPFDRARLAALMRCVPGDARPLDLVVSSQRAFESREDHGRAVWIAKCLGFIAAPIRVGPDEIEFQLTMVGVFAASLRRRVAESTA